VLVDAFPDARTGSPAPPAALERVHAHEYLRTLETLPGPTWFDYPNTIASETSWEAALLAAGCAIEAAETEAFALVRPPGHHAPPSGAMGFCLVNNIAIAARHMQAEHGVDRIAIVDFDVHHGNGTQEIFYSDPSVLYASTHQMPLFPGTGAVRETGVGNIFNSPLAAGDGGAELREAFEDRILPALDAFAPELIIVSAGFDAHERDPLGSLAMTADDFAWVTRALMNSAEKNCDGRLVAVLEGGYDLQGLADSVSAHVGELMKG
jgi:acetoin utilization deacetylase AcuC-like enzyme